MLEVNCQSFVVQVRTFFSDIPTDCQIRFVEAMIKPEIHDHFLAMPSVQEMLENIQMVWEKYKIPNTICGTDGCNFSFLERPRY